MPHRSGITRTRLLVELCGLLLVTKNSFSLAADFWVYFGGYTGGASRGIYVSRMDSAGKLTSPELAAKITNPSFLAVDSKNRFLYAISEVSSDVGKKKGDVASFALDTHTGRLTELNQQLSGGDTLCHVAVDAADKIVLIASYGGGSVSAFPMNADGSLGNISSFIQHHGSSINPANQKGPHAHEIITDPSNQFALVCDLGLDKVLVYRVNQENSTLNSNAVTFAALKPGSGPRHLAFHPNAKFVYVISEMGCSVTTFAFDSKDGSLTELQTVTTLPEGRTVDPALSGAEIVVHPSGKFLYGSTRGLDLISVFAVDEESGRLTLVENIPSGGKTPRNFNLDPTGNFLLAANQNSGNVVVFKINQETGRLTPTGQSVSVGNPSCVVFAPVK